MLVNSEQLKLNQIVSQKMFFFYFSKTLRTILINDCENKELNSEFFTQHKEKHILYKFELS